MSPIDIQFTRQAVRRLVFDKKSAIPLSVLKPAEIVNLPLEHPMQTLNGRECEYSLKSGQLRISGEKQSESLLWLGGFNAFATYDISIYESRGATVEVGVEFCSYDKTHRLVLLAGLQNNLCSTVRCQIIISGKEKFSENNSLKQPICGPFTFRVQMVGSGLNVYAEQNGVNTVLYTCDFSNIIDLRRKEFIRTFESHIITRLGSNESVTIYEAGIYLTTGAGQADMCAITNKDGSPLLEQGRLWFTMTIRGRNVDHTTQGVFSINPSVFDIKLEGIIVFDRGDGLLRNEIASHIFYDKELDEWHGLTVGFSAIGDPDKTVPKQLWAVCSKKDPRFGFSIMKAKKLEMPGSGEDPHIIYDRVARKWRVLVCSDEKGFPACLYESKNWDGPYKRIYGPVDVNSTGCLLQKFGSKYYALFGSSDREFYVYSYPELNKIGTLDMLRPPWDDTINTRCWPNVIPLPDGYPAPYIALTMDRVNYPDLPGWTYGALYLYHGHVTKENLNDQ
ncbi:MAG: hypothetical protein OCD02_04925 [Spirochaetaceae bacterium]